MEDCLEVPHLGNHETQLQTRKWRTHERKRNSWSSGKGGELRIALRVCSQAMMKHRSKLEREGHMNENARHGAPKMGENGGLP